MNGAALRCSLRLLRLIVEHVYISKQFRNGRIYICFTARAKTPV